MVEHLILSANPINCASKTVEFIVKLMLEACQIAMKFVASRVLIGKKLCVEEVSVELLFKEREERHLLKITCIDKQKDTNA